MTNNGATKVADGYSFDGIDDYIDSNYSPSSGNNYSLNDALVGAYLKTKGPAVGNRNLLGLADAGDIIRIMEQDANNRIQIRINQSGSANLLSETFQDQTYYVNTRVASNSIIFYKDGQQATTNNQASTSIPSNNLFIGAERSGGSDVGNYDGIISSFIAGSGIDFNQSAHNTNLRTLLTSLGVLP